MVTRLLLARILLRRVTLAAFFAGVMVGVVAGYTWKGLEVIHG